MGFDVLSYAIGLQAGKASGGPSGGSATYKHDNFRVTAGQMTVQHGGGAVPDLIIVALDDIPSDGEVFFTFGFSEAMLSKLGGGYINSVTAVTTKYSVTATSDTGIEGSGSDHYARYGGVRNVTATTFEIGNIEYTDGLLKSNSAYTWYAFYGLA